METKDFEQFVASQQQPQGPTKIDWAEQRDEWLANLNALYEKVIGFLKPYIDAGSISYSFADVELTESEIGTYFARQMDIRIGRQSVSLVPIGTLLIGCKGRIDVLGSVGKGQILLVDERAKSTADLIHVTVSIGNKPQVPPAPVDEKRTSWAWKILTSASPRRFVDVEQESFFALLVEIANG